jgi:GAF domain-containing protein
MMMVSGITEFLAPPVFEGDEGKTRIARMLNTMLLTVLGILLALALALVLLRLPMRSMIVIGAAGLPVILPLILLRRGRVTAASVIFCASLWLLDALLAFLLGGVSSPVAAGLILNVIAAGLLLGSRASFVMAGVDILTGLALFYVETQGILPDPIYDMSALPGFMTMAGNLVLATALLALAARGFDEALRRARLYAAEVEEQRGQLEEAVEERNQALARRARYLEATTVIAREAAAVMDDPQQFLTRAALLISRQFGFYHAGIFLVDTSGEWVELQAASSEGGARMLARKHRLRVGREGIVGYVVSQSKHRIAQNVGEDTAYFDNPDMPETRAEVALPLRVGRKVIGALDVQSTRVDAFDEESVGILQALADQIAVAINNARLFQQVEERAQTERRIYGELSQEGWRNLLQAEPNLAFLSHSEGIVAAQDMWRPEMHLALQTGRIATNDEGNTVAIPIKARGQVIGVIDGRKPANTGTWTAEEIEMLEELTDRLNVNLESARLYRESQRRAVREEMVGRITARMRETLDIETVMETAAKEISEALGLLALDVRLRTDTQSKGQAPSRQWDQPEM